MTFVPLDDGFFDHPKARAAGKDGRALYLAGLCHCGANLTDGRIDRAVLPLIAAKAEVRAAATARRLIDAGLWIEDGDGWQVAGYLDRNKTRAQVEAEKARKAAAGRKGAASRWQNRSEPDGTSHSTSHGRTEAPRIAAPTEPAWPPSPTPSPTSPSSSPSTHVPAPWDDEDDERIPAALTVEVDRRLRAADGRGGAIANPAAYRRAVEADVAAACLDEARRLLSDYPALSAGELATVIAGERNLLRHHRPPVNPDASTAEEWANASGGGW